MILKAELRKVTGTNATRQGRKEGKLPATLYSKGQETVSLFVNHHEFEAILRKEGQNAVLNLEFDGQTKQVLVKAFDRASLKEIFYSVDFQEVAANEKLQVEVPVVLLNVESVKEGVVDQVSTSVLVETTPANIPTAIEFDVTGLVIGDVKTVADLTVPANVELLTDAETTVVSIAVPTEVVEETEEVAEPEVIGEEVVE